MKYCILYHPGHNRVYFDTSVKLSLTEFAIMADKLSVNCTDIRRETLLGTEYLTFEAEGELAEADIRLIYELSFIYALFSAHDIEGQLYLRPVQRLAASFVDDGISSMLKYTGKTNEIFTRMMLNIASLQLDRREGIRLLDPIAGKGTTLYEGLVKGFHVFGIEIGDKVVAEAVNFVKRYLETARYKFSYASVKLTDPQKTYTAMRHSFDTAPTKEAFKAGETRRVEFVAGNSKFANKYYKKNTFDIIVGDLPYGVQHGNVTGGKGGSLTRNPSELLEACLPAWSEVLRPGGAIVLSWNSNVLPRHKFKLILEKHGLTVRDEEEYRSLEHRVDQAILRDVIVALKK